jgi:hydroxyacylglutathione hydrolase
MPLDVIRVPALSDNYAFLIRCSQTGRTAVIDTPEAIPILAAAREAGWRIDEIWNTHHHADHVQGNAEIADLEGAAITAPDSEAGQIGAVTRRVRPGDRINLGACEAQVLDVGGHTRGHIAYWFDQDKALFCGDALFALGCGRMFEGTPEQMQAGLARLRALPDDVVVWCAHEYTASNAKFALSVDPDNPQLRAYAEEVFEKRERGEPTVPTTMAREKAANPFLRWDDPAIRARLDMTDADDVAVFAELRRRKDGF